MRHLLLFCAALLTASSALGESGNIQRFVPQPATTGGLSTGSGEILRDGTWVVGVDVDRASNPLVQRARGAREASVSSALFLDVRAAIGLFDRLELGMVLPVAASVQGVGAAASIAGSALGDLVLQPRVRLLTQWKHGVALSLSPNVSIPLGGADALAGGGGLSFVPEVAVSKRFGKLWAAGQVHFLVRPEAVLPSGATLGHELGARAAVSYLVGTDTHLLVELDGAFAFATSSDGALGNPLEARVGARHFLGDTMAVDAGLGAGLFSAPGVPDVRVVLGFVYGRGLRPRPGTSCERVVSGGGTERLESFGSDRDGDAIDDACDLCLDQPETMNGFGDTDGCPDAVADSDGDVIPDAADKCPEIAGLAPSGCPDADGDGVSDDLDQCRDAAGPAPMGCPDADGDGVPDRLDECRNEAGAAPSGCPDTDGDGLPDRDDKCPAVKGPAPGGCPDSDGDGLTDDVDDCPEETGVAPTGCPPEAKPLVVVTTERIEIRDRVYFGTSVATIEPRSFKLLEAIARTLRLNPRLGRIRIEGHTDDVGAREANVTLSALRAEAVRAFLVEHGVSPSRLVAEGFGPDRPLVPNTTDENRAKNRRVEFVTVDEAKQ